MSNVISFRLNTTTRPGCRPVTWLFGSEAGGLLYLGSVRVEDGDVTTALREFGLETAVAPDGWPSAYEQVTCDEDPRRAR
jgi:hypothetical protein